MCHQEECLRKSWTWLTCRAWMSESLTLWHHMRSRRDSKSSRLKCTLRSILRSSLPPCTQAGRTLQVSSIANEDLDLIPCPYWKRVLSDNRSMSLISVRSCTPLEMNEKVKSPVVMLTLLFFSCSPVYALIPLEDAGQAENSGTGCRHSRVVSDLSRC